METAMTTASGRGTAGVAASRVGVDSVAARAAFIGVALLALVAPFEITAPLISLPRQSVSNLEAAVVCALAVWGLTIAWSLRMPRVNTPLTVPWIALLATMIVASLWSPVSRINALHMTGRLTAALGVYLLAVNAVGKRARLRTALGLSVAAGVAVAVLAILEYLRVSQVLSALEAFRPGVALIGAQVRAGGPLQYPTVASMYLEVVFACGLGLWLAVVDEARGAYALLLAVALVVIAEGITLTFTRAGLITMAASLALVGIVRYRRRGWERGGKLLAALAVAIAVMFLASRSAQFVWLRLTSEGQESWYRMQVDAPSDLDLTAGAISTVPVRVTNTGRLPWDSRGEPPFFFSNHWRQTDGKRYVTFEGARTGFETPVEPGVTVDLSALVRVPRQPGRYLLEWDAVQEGRLWFSTEPGATPTVSRATVTGAASDVPLRTSPPMRRAVRPGRFVLWRAAVRMFVAHPLLGVGPDNFRLAYGDDLGIADTDPRTHSNNMYLETIAGGGLLVGLAFAWFLWRAAGCFAASAASDPASILGAGIAAAGLAIGLHAFVDSFLSFAPTYVLFALTLGFASACARGGEAGLDAHRV